MPPRSRRLIYGRSVIPLPVRYLVVFRTVSSMYQTMIIFVSSTFLCIEGFHTCLFFGAAYFISKTGAEPRVRILQNLFIFILFVLGTIYIGCDSTFLEMMFIEDRDFPGGPAMFLEARYGASRVSTATNVISCIGTAVADGVLVCLPQNNIISIYFSQLPSR